MYLNKVILCGRLGGEVALRYLPSGDPVCSFSIATQWEGHTEWHQIVCYRDLAELANRKFGKGDMVFVDAYIKTRESVNAQNQKRRVLELIANQAYLVLKAGNNSMPPVPTDQETESKGPASVKGIGFLRSSLLLAWGVLLKLHLSHAKFNRAALALMGSGL